MAEEHIPVQKGTSLPEGQRGLVQMWYHWVYKKSSLPDALDMPNLPAEQKGLSPILVLSELYLCSREDTGLWLRIESMQNNIFNIYAW